MANNALLEIKNISKSFGPTKALIDVSFQVFPGEVRGLIGENGSGKSTISSIISGLQKADQGELIFQSQSYQPQSVIDASRQGICMIVQEQSTVDTITVAANIFIGKEDMFSRRGIIQVKAMERQAKDALERIGVSHIAPGELTKRLSFEERKLVEIARAYYMNPKVLIIDETTTALSMSGRDILYALMRRICRDGGAVVFISHDIEEVMERSDVLTVLRDGAMIASLSKPEFSPDRIRSLMVGREINSDYYRVDKKCHFDNDVVLAAEGVSSGNVKNINLQLHRGEILGIGGLTECGMHDLGKILFGARRPERGRVTTGDGAVVKDPHTAIQKHIGYMSKNRDVEALFTTMSIKDNICVSAYQLIGRKGIIARRAEYRFSRKWAETMQVKMESVDAAVNSLSGGNKQKVVFSKWLSNETDIFIMDCPTRGIDVGVKAAIYRLMERLKAEGKSIIMISEELPELLGMSDRVLILKDGALNGAFFRNREFDEQVLIKAMI